MSKGFLLIIALLFVAACDSVDEEPLDGNTYVWKHLPDTVLTKESPTVAFQLTRIFSHTGRQQLTYTTALQGSSATATIVAPDRLEVRPTGIGRTTIIVTATDQTGLSENDTFLVTVNRPLSEGFFPIEVGRTWTYDYRLVVGDPPYVDGPPPSPYPYRKDEDVGTLTWRITAVQLRPDTTFTIEERFSGRHVKYVWTPEGETVEETPLQRTVNFTGRVKDGLLILPGYTFGPTTSADQPDYFLPKVAFYDTPAAADGTFSATVERMLPYRRILNATLELGRGEGLRSSDYALKQLNPDSKMVRTLRRKE